MQAVTGDLYSWRCPKSRLPSATIFLRPRDFRYPLTMSDIEPGLDNHIGEPTPPLREGLPPRFRMRADAHYVEELDSALFSAPIRHLDVRTIDPI
jgi:hypothetical protein